MQLVEVIELTSLSVASNGKMVGAASGWVLHPQLLLPVLLKHAHVLLVAPQPLGTAQPVGSEAGGSQ